MLTFPYICMVNSSVCTPTAGQALQFRFRRACTIASRTLKRVYHTLCLAIACAVLLAVPSYAWLWLSVLTAVQQHFSPQVSVLRLSEQTYPHLKCILASRQPFIPSQWSMHDGIFSHDSPIYLSDRFSHSSPKKLSDCSNRQTKQYACQYHSRYPQTQHQTFA